MLVATALPALADSPGVGNSTFVVQNIDPAAAMVSVDYYDQEGAEDQQGAPFSLAGRGNSVFNAANLPVGDGWVGSVVISADKVVSAVTCLDWQSSYGSTNDQITGGCYSGTYEPTTDLYMPYATTMPEGSIAGKLARFSQITVQNAGTGDAHIHVYYYNSRTGAMTGPVDDTIGVGRSVTYNLSTPADPMVPDLGAEWQGSVYIHSDDQPIAGVATSHWAGLVSQQWGSAYEGASAGGTTLYGPSVFRIDRRSEPAVGTWVRSSNIMVQNLGDATAAVTVEFYATGSTTPAMTITDNIPAKQMGEYNTRFGSPTNNTYPASAFEALGNAFMGSVIITSTNGQPLASVIHTFWNRPNENSASTYQAETTGSDVVFVPYAPKVMNGTAWSKWSKIAIQNLGDQTATLSFSFYDAAGAEVLAFQHNIAANSGDAYNTRFGSDSGEIPASQFAALGTNFTGSVRIGSTQPIVAVVNIIGVPVIGDTYNAFVP